MTPLALALALAATPAHAPGETMEFNVDFHGIRTGKARISVGHLEGAILPVFLEARTSGVLAIVELKQQLASYLDVETGLPRSWSIDSVEPGYRRTDTIRVDRPNGKATVREKGRFDNTYEIDVPPDAVDFVALVFRLRTLPLEPGTTHAFQVLASRKVQPIEVTVEDRERVKTKAGKFDAVRVRVPTQFSGKFSEQSPTYVWFSDDARRIVVRISTDFAIGRVVAGLTTYRPGAPPEGAPAPR